MEQRPALYLLYAFLIDNNNEINQLNKNHVPNCEFYLRKKTRCSAKKISISVE